VVGGVVSLALPGGGWWPGSIAGRQFERIVACATASRCTMHACQILTFRNETALSATMMLDADISSADTSGRNDQPSEL